MGPSSSHPLAGPFADWLGTWEGEGRGHWRADPPFRYRERLTLRAVPERALLRIEQVTTVLESGELSHTETGFLRLLGEGRVELVLAIAAGYVETHEGGLADRVLELAPRDLAVTLSARPLSRVRRRLELAGAELHHQLWIAVGPAEPAPHVESWLRRLPED